MWLRACLRQAVLHEAAPRSKKLVLCRRGARTCCRLGFLAMADTCNPETFRFAATPSTDFVFDIRLRELDSGDFAQAFGNGLY